jgi:phosphotransacetylase
MIARFEQLIDHVCAGGPRQAVFMMPTAEAGLHVALLAAERGLAYCTLVGDAAAMQASADEGGLDLSALSLVDQPDAEQVVRQAIDLCREGQGDVLVNDGASSRVLLPALLDRKKGLRAGSLFTGVSAFELAEPQRLLLLSDALMVVSPNLEQRIAIVEGAIDVAHRLGIELPRVALVAATETVNLKSASSAAAAQITMMGRRKQITGALIDGPLGFDNAVSAHAAQVKGIDSEVAGQVDVLIAPDLEAGNLLLKTLSSLCRVPAANVVIGGKVPLVLWSSLDGAQERLAAMALGILCS